MPALVLALCNVQVKGVVVSVRGVCCPEHVHNASKWHPTMSVVIEC